MMRRQVGAWLGMACWLGTIPACSLVRDGLKRSAGEGNAAKTSSSFLEQSRAGGSRSIAGPLSLSPS